MLLFMTFILFILPKTHLLGNSYISIILSMEAMLKRVSVYRKELEWILLETTMKQIVHKTRKRARNPKTMELLSQRTNEILDYQVRPQQNKRLSLREKSRVKV